MLKYPGAIFIYIDPYLLFEKIRYENITFKFLFYFVEIQ